MVAAGGYSEVTEVYDDLFYVMRFLVSEHRMSLLSPGE